ncbi:hypothetical protein ACF1BQ_025075 [Bradyrhizobium sp. RDT10]
MLFPFSLGCNFAETGDSTNDGRFPEGCADRVSLGGDQELSSFIRMILDELAKRTVSAISKNNRLLPSAL